MSDVEPKTMLRSVDNTELEEQRMANKPRRSGGMLLEPKEKLVPFSDSDRLGIKTLYERYVSTVYEQMRTFFPSMSDMDVDIIVSEVFSRVVEHYKKIKDLKPPQIASYIAKVCNSVKAEVVNRSTREQPLSYDSSLASLSDEEIVTNGLVLSDKIFVDNIVLKHALRKCLGSLDEADRRLFVGRVLEHKTYSELAAEFGITPNAAFRKYESIRNNLVKLMRGEGYNRAE